MATYKEIREYVKEKYGYTPKDCHIAHMKEICHIPVRMSPHRRDPAVRQVPCPEERQNDIREAFKHFGMI